MDEGASVPEVRRHAESTSVYATGIWNEGSASYPGRPAVLLVKQIVAERRDDGTAWSQQRPYELRLQRDEGPNIEERTGANHS
jgi:plasmid replication initiation protein